MDEEAKATEIAIRNYIDSDYSFILNSWLLSYRDGNEFVEAIPKDVYFKFHHQVIDGILKRQSSEVLVATAIDDTDLIYGYAVFERISTYKIMHYTYVKRTFSQFGIASALIERAPFNIKDKVYASHLTHKGSKIIAKFGLTYCPYLS